MGRGWPLVVRRAVAADREAVLAFASRTWDGWDYVPNAWPLWLSARDGVLLVGCVGRPADDGQPTDHDGSELRIGRPVAVARVAMLSASEAWLEGIRVDPAVRGMDVATDLQVAELQWAAAQQARVVRYATGERNEGSHRLGARHGFALLAAFRTYWWSDRESPEADEDDEDDGSGFVDDARLRAEAERSATLGRLEQRGLVGRAGHGEALWQLVESDGSFTAGGRLYEHRAWALQELTRERFERHLERGEIVVSPAGRSLGVFERSVLPAEDVSLNLGLLCGEAPGALSLAAEIQRAAGESIRFRLPDSDESLIRGHEDEFAATGFHAREWTLHILTRPLGGAAELPVVEPRRLILEDPPAPLLEPVA